MRSNLFYNGRMQFANRHIERVKPEEMTIIGWQKEVSYASLWNIIIAMREGEELPPVRLRSVLKSDALFIDAKKNDPRSTNKRKDGGHARVAAAYIERAPLTAELGGRALLWLPDDAIGVSQIELVEKMGNEDSKRAENPQFYTHVPNRSEIEYMQDRLATTVNF